MPAHTTPLASKSFDTRMQAGVPRACLQSFAPTLSCLCCAAADLKVSLSDFLTLFSARTNPGPFWSQRPGARCAEAGKALLAASNLKLLWPACCVCRA